jgi:hypothetical protein
MKSPYSEFRRLQDLLSVITPRDVLSCTIASYMSNCLQSSNAQCTELLNFIRHDTLVATCVATRGQVAHLTQEVDVGGVVRTALPSALQHLTATLPHTAYPTSYPTSFPPHAFSRTLSESQKSLPPLVPHAYAIVPSETSRDSTHHSETFTTHAPPHQHAPATGGSSSTPAAHPSHGTAPRHTSSGKRLQRHSHPWSASASTLSADLNASDGGPLTQRTALSMSRSGGYGRSWWIGSHDSLSSAYRRTAADDSPLIGCVLPRLFLLDGKTFAIVAHLHEVS